MEVKLTKAEFQWLMTCVIHCSSVTTAEELPQHDRWLSTRILQRVHPGNSVSENILTALFRKLNARYSWNSTGDFWEERNGS